MATSKSHYIQFLRNTTTPLCSDLAAAKTAISGQIANALDGEPILARYYDGQGGVKTVLGIVHKVDDKTGVTFYTDNDEIESIIKSYVGTGVTTGNTVTAQLEAINAEIDADKVHSGAAIDVASAETGTTVSVKYDNSTVVLNSDGELSVASSALTPYVGSNAVSVTTGTTAHTISLGIDANDNVLTQGTDGLLANLSLEYVTTGETPVIQLFGKNGTSLGSVDASNFIKDSFLSGVSYDAQTQVLTFTWNTESGIDQTNVNLSGLVDTYSAASGIAVSNNQFTGVVDGNSEQVVTGDSASASVLSVGANGFRVDNIQNAIDYKYNLATAYTDSAKTVVTGSTYITVTPGTPAGTGTTYTVASSGLATSAELTTETNNRTSADTAIHTIMGQAGSAYTANSEANYIAGASSLNNADTILDSNLKALSGKVENLTSDSLSGVTVNGTNVTVTDHVAIVNLSGSNLSVSSGYTVSGKQGDVETGDTLDNAIAKVEVKANANASAITAETQARENADSALSAAIDSHKVVVAADDSALDGTQYVTVSTAYTDSNSANGITYTVSVDGLADIVASARTDINTVSGIATGNSAAISAATTGYSAANANQFVTAVTQTNGKITAVEFGQPAASGVTFSAGTGTGALTSTTVQAAVDEVNTKVNNLDADSKLTILSTGDSTSDVKKYEFYQGNTGNSANLVGTINIPKDLVVTSGDVVDVEGVKNIKLTLTSGNDIYIPVNELVDAYSGVTAATGVSVYVSNENGISASLTNDAVATANIQNSAVTTAKIADENVTSAKLSSDVQSAINASITAVSDSDTIDMELNNRSVSANVKSSSITSTHLANSAVTEDKIAGSAVTTSKIADDAVTADKLADAVTADIASRLTQVSVNNHSATTASTAITLVTEDITIGDGYDDTFTATTAGAPASGDTIDQALAKLYKSIAANKIANGNVTTTGTTAGGETKVDVTVDDSSIKVDTTSNALTVGTVDCGTY